MRRRHISVAPRSEDPQAAIGPRPEPVRHGFGRGAAIGSVDLWNSDFWPFTYGSRPASFGVEWISGFVAGFKSSFWRREYLGLLAG
jgi:hypothetical protein